MVAASAGNYAIAHCGAQSLFHCTLCMQEGGLESYCTLRTVILNLPIKVKYVHNFLIYGTYICTLPKKITPRRAD